MARGKNITPVEGPRRFEFLVSFGIADGTASGHAEIARELLEMLETCGVIFPRISWKERALAELKAVPLTTLEREASTDEPVSSSYKKEA